MKRFLTFLFIYSFASLSIAENCPAPKIQKVSLEAVNSDNQVINFGGRYTLNIIPSSKVIFSNDMLAYIYEKNKHFVIHADTEINVKNKEQFLDAFGLNSNKTGSEARKALNLCDGVITKYLIKGMPEIIISVDSTVVDKPNTMVYLFNEVTPFVETIQFLGFSKEEIKQTLSTLKNVTRK